MAQDKDDEKEKGGGAKGGGKPQLTPIRRRRRRPRRRRAPRPRQRAARAPERAKAARPRKRSPPSASSATRRPRLRKLYDAEIRAKLMQEFSLANRMEAPKLTRITINMGLGEAVTNPKLLDSAVDELGAITGQRPVVTRAKKSIAVFKLRAGQKIGVMVTLRRDQMYEFFDRLVCFALPRVRDFKGVSPKSFDGRGNYTMGIREEIIFPEINFEKLDKPKGMNITFNTSAPNDEQGRALLKHLGMPFRN